MGVTASLTIEAYLDGAWEDLTPDTVARSGLTIKSGIDGSSPADVVAAVGTCSFTLRNDAGNSGGVEGYYSPRHANVRDGWGFGVPVRVAFSSGVIEDAMRFTGFVTTIDAEPGAYRAKRVRVTCEDGIRKLLDADVREVAIQQGKTEAELIGVVLDSLPADAQPVARSLDTGANVLPVAFDDLGSGVKALGLIGELARASQGKVFLRGDGALVYRNRHNLGPLASSSMSFSDDMHGLRAPSSVDACFNRVRVTTRQKTISLAATERLYDNVVDLPAATSNQEFWTDYTDPLSGERRTRIGGTDVVTTLVAGVHYFAGSEPGGTELTANITATLTPFATTAKWTLSNSGASAAKVTLRVVGKAIRDLGPSVREAVSTQAYGARTFGLDLKYQGSSDFGGQLAAHLVTLYEDLDNQIESVEFIANASSDFMAAALQRQPGDIVTITESMTGITSATQCIQSVELQVSEPCWIRCRWTLAPADISGGAWVLGTSELTNDAELAL